MMGSNVHQLPCSRWEQEDYGCIDCNDYPCMLWKVIRGEMRLPGEIERWNFIGCYDFDLWARDMFEKRDATGFIALEREEK